ncbi:hypothetical protein SAMN05660860_02525 [Geoalkalibacter ferrihydriticus]|uniref:Uncharacterized protein n=2 Tax=Geoalkalibacter ferrihydriticus TaxID=392333 RepID=A0A0C2HGP4_9BACT|nr:hypothetical protein [Geoalkalibacter ferrihydriticus]KIH76121.1 hypothetical protein GFER_12880 [Geoalkalibacter ferrihydriticus DSM 17813]SDM44127.1 hypothetical protein SAMN05660860_02525 [Geoalkalibacter ferrihydriticus]
MAENRAQIPPLFLNRFAVQDSDPFRRYLNRLEVEIGREDYRHLKRVDLVEPSPPDAAFAAMEEITERLLKTTQNNYNRQLLLRQGIRVYLDRHFYHVWYRLKGRSLRFSPLWRENVLRRFFGRLLCEDSGWHPGPPLLPGAEARFLPDEAGGVLLLRRPRAAASLPLLTATHGPYDPHTFEVALYFLHTGKARAALINLGFAGREPLTDENLEKLKKWGVPLNPSNIDVIYPYVDSAGHPYCYKLEKGFARYAALLGGARPKLVIDIHGCVGTDAQDHRLIVGLGGLPPYLAPADIGRVEQRGAVLHLFPRAAYRDGLALLRDLSEEIYVQFCETPHRAYHFAVLGRLQLIGRTLDPHAEVRSLLAGEERTFLPAENIRWLPGAGGNALQRMEARRFEPGAVCLHVEIPTAVRRKMALRLGELATAVSLESSGL